MPRAPIPSVIASQHWAIDRSYPVDAVLQAVSQHTEADVNADQLRTSGRFHHYVNPSGEVVSSMEADFSRRIQQGAVAVIPAKGIMVKECAMWMEYYGLCSSDRVARDIDRARADDRVKEIVCIAQSPGGDIAGTENLDRTVKEAAAKKKVTVFVDGMMCSASYWGFAHGTTIVADGATTTVGSLGVMSSITDDSAFWKALGIETKDIYDETSQDKNKEVRAALAGDNKPMQDRLAPFKAAMVAAVMDGRKGLIDRGREDVLTGKVYSGNDAKAFGLIDRMDSLKAVLHEAVTPNTTAQTPNPFQQATDKTMSKFMTAVTAIAAVFGFTEEKKTATAEEITKANKELEPFALQMVTVEQAKELANLDALKAEAAKVKDLEAKASAAAANDTAVKAALKECGIEAAEGKELTAALDALKAKPGAAHTGAKKEGDKEKPQYAGHDAALTGSGVVSDASVKAKA